MPAEPLLALNNRKSPVSAFSMNYFSLTLSNFHGFSKPFALLFMMNPSLYSICLLNSCCHIRLSTGLEALNSNCLFSIPKISI